MTPLSVSDRVSVWAGNRVGAGAGRAPFSHAANTRIWAPLSVFWTIMGPQIHTNLPCGSQVRGTVGGTDFVRVLDEFLFATLHTNAWYRGAFSFVKTVVFVTYTSSFEFANNRQKVSQNDPFERHRSRQHLGW